MDNIDALAWLAPRLAKLKRELEEDLGWKVDLSLQTDAGSERGAIHVHLSLRVKP